MKPKNVFPNRWRFHRVFLPTAFDYYQKEFPRLKIRGTWAQAPCPFHKEGKEKHPSLSVHLGEGHFKCHACGASGGDIITFQRKRYGQSFPQASRALGAWL